VCPTSSPIRNFIANAAAEPPLSQRQHLGRSSKTAAQRRLLEAGSDADEEGDENSERGDSGSDGDGARGSAEADTEPEDAAAADSEPDGSPEAHARPSQVGLDECLGPWPAMLCAAGGLLHVGALRDSHCSPDDARMLSLDSNST